MLKKVRKWLVFIILLTVYLNIGWGLGYYFYYNISTKTFESASWHAKLLGGHCLLFPNEANIKANKESGLWPMEICLSIIWPFLLLLSVVSWVVHFACWIFKFICAGGFWILKFIFAGGLFKLIFGLP